MTILPSLLKLVKPTTVVETPKDAVGKRRHRFVELINEQIALNQDAMATKTVKGSKKINGEKTKVVKQIAIKSWVTTLNGQTLLVPLYGHAKMEFAPNMFGLALEKNAKVADVLAQLVIHTQAGEFDNMLAKVADANKRKAKVVKKAA